MDPGSWLGTECCLPVLSFPFLTTLLPVTGCAETPRDNRSGPGPGATLLPRWAWASLRVPEVRLLSW